MHMNEAGSKVTASHLKRDAYLYVRQSTLRQVFENTESTQRQYALRQRAVALGWPLERVHVIDSDLGQSGASAADREGFQKLVSEVSLGRAGIVLGLEVSRLARNNTDWHRLLEICALSDTLILDEDGLYSPNSFNDRLLLGLKGTMSEEELHLLRARLRGGLLNKARRGELAGPLPVGFSYDAQNGYSWIPINRYEKPSLFFLRPIAGAVVPWEWSNTFERRDFFSLVVCEKDPVKGNWSGGNWNTAVPCSCYITHVMPVRFSSEGRGHGSAPMVVYSRKHWIETTGKY
jgi:DNA invertase Pin-like site-specific DNA recombinase